MKKTLIALATTATIALGTAATASAAPNAGLDITAGKSVSVEQVRGGRRGGYDFQSPDYGFRAYCQDLYYKGWVLDILPARHLYLVKCNGRTGY